MRSFIVSIVAACMLGLSTPGIASMSPDSLRTQRVVPSAEVEILTSRLEELKAMDKSRLTKNEKRVLKKEVRTIEAKLRSISGGVYISASALIIILILLVLFA